MKTVVEFWEARSALLRAVGGYRNLRFLSRLPGCQRALRKARRGELTYDELNASLVEIAGQTEIQRPSSDSYDDIQASILEAVNRYA